MKKWQAVSGVLLASGLFQSTGWAQNALWNQLNPLNPSSSGLHISSVTLSTSNFSESFSDPLAGRSTASATMLEGSATFNWVKVTDKSSVLAVYSPSYLQQFQLSNYRSFDQFLSVSATRKPGSKVTLVGSFQGLTSDFSQSLFAPSLYGLLSAYPATFEELLSLMLGGQSANPGLTQLIGASALNGSPQTAYFYGGRELSTSANISLLYAPSTRSSFTASVQGARAQFLRTGSSGANSGPQYLIPATTGVSANLGWSYQLTPRTTVGVNASSSLAISRFEDAYATEFSGSIGRALSTRWFVQAMVGAGYIIPVRETFARRPGAQPVFGGSVGYKFAAQTLLGSYTRTASDSFGLGAEATQSSAGAWTWNRPRSTISLSAGFGYSHLTGRGLPTISTWTSQVGLTKRIEQLSLSATYSYAQYPDPMLLEAPNFALRGVMVGLSWAPSVRR